MNTLLLQPTDFLFFKDGRPMSGSLAGHGAAWPLPTVASAALHAALHRAGDQFKDVRLHRQGRSRDNRSPDAPRDRKFGSLLTAGPFPVWTKGGIGTWFFPRPLDAAVAGTSAPSFLPMEGDFDSSSLPSPLRYAVVNTAKPCKDPLKPWWNEAAWNAYTGMASFRNSTGQPDFKLDSDFSDTEHAIGIGMDMATGTQDGKRFYSAHYLRLREDWRLGLLAEATDRIEGNPQRKRDLIAELFPNQGTDTSIIVGGQQRLCTVHRCGEGIFPLPLGKTDGFASSGDKPRLKWVLLTPAIFPQIGKHSGGWLPSWIDSTCGQVQLLDGPGANAARRHKTTSGKPIAARLVAASVGKPVTVTGYAFDNGLEDRKPGPKPTYMAVPAGSVYYFECEDSQGALKLAAALNWHGSDTDPERIKNRRSTLMGEKGFGLGVCSTWDFYNNASGHPVH